MGDYESDVDPLLVRDIGGGLQVLAEVGDILGRVATQREKASSRPRVLRAFFVGPLIGPAVLPALVARSYSPITRGY